jgi:hypothetical protein
MIEGATGKFLLQQMAAVADADPVICDKTTLRNHLPALDDGASAAGGTGAQRDPRAARAPEYSGLATAPCRVGAAFEATAPCRWERRRIGAVPSAGRRIIAVSAVRFLTPTF